LQLRIPLSLSGKESKASSIDEEEQAGPSIDQVADGYWGFPVPDVEA